MTSLWIARLTGQNIPYGPFGEAHRAGDFARWLTRQVDPAEVLRLRDPVAELLHAQGAGLVDPETGDYVVVDRLYLNALLALAEQSEIPALADTPAAVVLHAASDAAAAIRRWGEP